jgi:uncharacterized protein YdaU (DUF1376 family)
MAALPYMQLYVADYLADTAHLTTLEHGAYLMLMFNYWQRGESFKANDERSLNKRLATVARLSVSEWDEVKGALSEFFDVTDTEWSQARIERDLAAVNAKSTKAKQAGKASAERRLNERSTNVEQTLNHTDTDTDTDTEAKEKTLVPSADDTSAYSAEFESFWTEYPKREGSNSKKTAFKAWNARLRSGVKAEDLILAAKRYAAQQFAAGNLGTPYVKQAATFLGADEHFREVLASNIHPIRQGRDGDGKLQAGFFYHPDDNGVPLHERRVLSRETHDPATGYLLSYLRQKGRA